MRPETLPAWLADGRGRRVIFERSRHRSAEPLRGRIERRLVRRVVIYRPASVGTPQEHASPPTPSPPPSPQPPAPAASRLCIGRQACRIQVDQCRVSTILKH